MPDDSCTPAWFWTRSVWPKPSTVSHHKPDLGWFCTIWSRMSVDDCNQVWKWKGGGRLVASCQKLGLMNPANEPASRPDAFRQTLTRPSRSDAGQFCTVWSMISLEKWNWIRCGKSDQADMIRPNSGCMLAATAITRPKQKASGLDPACLQGHEEGPTWSMNLSSSPRCSTGRRSLSYSLKALICKQRTNEMLLIRMETIWRVRLYPNIQLQDIFCVQPSTSFFFLLLLLMVLVLWLFFFLHLLFLLLHIPPLSWFFSILLGFLVWIWVKHSAILKIMTDILIYCPPPPPHSTHTHNHTHNTHTHSLSLSHIHTHTHTHTHIHTTHAHNTQHTHTTHAHNTHTTHTHTTHTHNTRTQHTHTTHAHNTRTQHTHTTHAHNTRTQHTHTTHAHNTRTQHTHTTHAHNTHTTNTHTTHTHNTHHKHTQHTHTTHTHNTHTQHTHTTHTHNTHTQHTHTTHAHNTRTQHTHTTNTHSTVPHPLASLHTNGQNELQKLTFSFRNRHDNNNNNNNNSGW